MTLFERDFINAKHSNRVINTVAFFQSGKAIEYFSYSRLTKPFTHSNTLTCPGFEGLINMYLESNGLPTMSIYKG